MENKDSLLWRRLTKTDFRAINGQAAQSGTGGGAMHISIGTDRPAFRIKEFLDAGQNATVTIPTVPNAPDVPAAQLTFAGDPGRRGGEWRITDQFHHRHPSWSTQAGFPLNYDHQDKPVVFVIKIEGTFHARYSSESALRASAPSLGAKIDASRKSNSGILDFDPSWSVLLDVPAQLDHVSAYDQLLGSDEANLIAPFDPKDVNDGRSKIIREVVRRQGQQAFRKKLLSAYGGICAISRCNAEWTLQAAHITPYRGTHTNVPSNGLLLRADLHTLFDLGLITIDPRTRTVCVSSQLEGTEYTNLEGVALVHTINVNDSPSEAALREHNLTFRA